MLSGCGLMSRKTLAATATQLDDEAEMGHMEADGMFDDAGLYAKAAQLLNAHPNEEAIFEAIDRISIPMKRRVTWISK
jgi:hypothetical protein